MSEVKIDIIKEGDGTTFAKPGDTVVMHYVGTLAKDGSKFDSSRDRGEPFRTTIGVGQVIAGWDEAVPKLSKSTKAMLTIPSAKGYGARGASTVIPPHADLKFEVELLDVIPQGSEPSSCAVM